MRIVLHTQSVDVPLLDTGMPLSAMPCGFEDSLLDFESSIALNVADTATVESADDWVVEVADFDQAAALKTEATTSQITTGYTLFIYCLLFLIYSVPISHSIFSS